MIPRLFIEHVAAPRETRMRRIQNLITPFWKRLGDGCHPNRETWIDIESAGFEKVTFETITAPTPIVSPQIVGVAAKAGRHGYKFSAQPILRSRER